MWKELRSHYYHPHSKKRAEQTENQQLLLDPSETWGPGKLLPWKLEREVNTENHGLRTLWGPEVGAVSLGTETTIDELFQVPCGLTWEQQIKEWADLGRMTFLSVTSRCAHRFTLWGPEKNSLILLERDGGKQPFEIAQSSLSSP